MIRYFNLLRPPIARMESASTLSPFYQQVAIYLAVVLGILAVPLIKDVALTIPDALSVRNVIVALVIGLAIFPTAYRNAFDTTAPLLSQAGVAIMTGIGWQNIVDTTLKASGRG